jgi:Transposase DDE domain group 1
VVDLQYQAKSWHKPRVAAKIEWHQGELFPRIGFVVTSAKLPAGKVTKVYNGRSEIENRIHLMIQSLKSHLWEFCLFA